MDFSEFELSVYLGVMAVSDDKIISVECGKSTEMNANAIVSWRESRDGVLAGVIR